MRKSFWEIEKIEGYWVPDITVKCFKHLPKCPKCHETFGAIAFDYNYCPNCGKQMYEDVP